MNFTRFTPDLRHRAFGGRREGRPFKALLKPQLESEFSFSHAQLQPNSSFFLGQD